MCGELVEVAVGIGNIGESSEVTHICRPRCIKRFGPGVGLWPPRLWRVGTRRIAVGDVSTVIDFLPTGQAYEFCRA
jgi:hypothetical protein